MNIESKTSGLLVATYGEPAPPPEDARRIHIRNWLRTLEFDGFEQTTHGMIGNRSIEFVAERLVRAYNDPSAFSISDLRQACHLLK